MPCCIAIIQFACGHHRLLPLACTSRDCDGLCTPERQRLLVRTVYIHNCEDCHERTWNERNEAHKVASEKRRNSVNDARFSPETQEELLFILKRRERHEEHVADKLQMRAVEEIQWVCEWTADYGAMVWEVKYARMWDAGEAARRIEHLRALRLWDLVVVRDRLRGKRQLYEDQKETSPFLIEPTGGDDAEEGETSDAETVMSDWSESESGGYMEEDEVEDDEMEEDGEFEGGEENEMADGDIAYEYEDYEEDDDEVEDGGDEDNGKENEVEEQQL